MRKPSLLKTLAALALTLTGSLSVSPAFAAGTPAGTVITNQASLDYTPLDGPPTSVLTPPVETTVIGRCAVSVLPNGTVTQPGQTYTLLPGESAVLKYTVSNTGNKENTVSLEVLREVASQFTPSGLTIHVDANNDGVVNANEPAINSLTLPIDGQVTLLVQVGTATTARGNAYLNLVSSCGGTDGELDNDNVALVTVGNPPQLGVEKTFTGTALQDGTGGVVEIKPGEEFTVNIVGRNEGFGASRALTITDFLNTPDMRDFVFVSGSARVQGSGVIEYSANGTTWSTTQTSPVAAIRVRADSLAPGATVGLSFNLRAPATDVGVKRNTAVLESDGARVEDSADIKVRYLPKIALGPIGNPEALPGGELSADDKQVKQNALLGQEVCFPHTVKNLGDRPDTITITGQVALGEATIRFTERDGTPITEPFIVPDLAPQATKDFNACYTPTKANGSSAAEALRVVLTAKSSRGAADNQTIDCIINLETNALNPVKAVASGNNIIVEAGKELTYTLTFTNTQSFALNNVVITDSLKNVMVYDPDRKLIRVDTLEFVSADNGGVLEGDAVVWRFAKINPGETVTLTLKAVLPAGTPDGAVVENAYNVTSDEVTTPTPSNTVNTPIFDQANLRLVKTSSPTTAAIGQAITYTFTITNLSTTGYLNVIRVDDTLPEGLAYIAGSSTVDGTPITPTVVGRQYTWTIPGLAPGATAVVSFRAEVLPNVGTQLRNNAVATAISNEGEVKSQPSTAVNNINAGIFENLSDIVGYVFLDVNRNGIFEQGRDIPCVNARVVLANGRIALTDTMGRYHFSNLKEGTYALRLDPNSVAAQNMSMPQDAGRPGSRLVYARNLTSVDFPLAPEGGDLAVIRDTTLRVTSTLPGAAASSLTIRKQVFTTEEAGVYRVQLILSAQPNLAGVNLTDPLPEGATLVDGQNTMTYDTLPTGERAVTYRFRWAGDPKGAVTDPTASWRYGE